MADITLPDGTVLTGAPEGTTVAQAVARARTKGYTGPGVSTGDDTLESIRGGIQNGAVNSVMFPAQAAVGAAGAVADKMHLSPAWLEALAGKVNELTQTLRAQPGHSMPGIHIDPAAHTVTSDAGHDIPSAANYQPQTNAGQWGASIAAGVGNSLLGNPATAGVRAAGGAASGALSEEASQLKLGPYQQALAAALPNLLMAGKDVALPNQSKLAVQKAATANPGELAAAQAVMTAARTPTSIPVSGTPNGPAQPIPVRPTPILPGQAFGPGHQMEGIQESLLNDPTVGPALQAQLRQQGAASAASTATGNNPNVTLPDGTPAPKAPYRAAYDAAEQGPISTSDAIQLAVALGRVRSIGNPAGQSFATAKDLANQPINISGTGGGFNPASNLGQVKTIGENINAADLNPATKNAMGDTVDSFLRNKDGRFSAADTANEMLMDNAGKVALGRGGMGSAATGDAGISASTPTTAARFNAYGPIALLPMINPAVRASQAKDMAKIMGDTSGKSLSDAAAYSPGSDAWNNLVQALSQARLQTSPGQLQGQ